MSQPDQGGINSGIFALNDRQCPDTATIAVTGMGRSGTTMIARILAALGVELGDTLSPQFLEDVRFVRAFKVGDMDEVTQLVADRDAAHAKWGFKLPAMRAHLPQMEQILRAPRFIITFRDPAAIALRNNLSMDADLATALRLAAKGMHKLANLVLDMHSPVLLVSYEKALQHPEQTVTTIAAFCGISLAEEGQAKKMAAQCICNGDPAYLQPVPALVKPRP